MDCYVMISIHLKLEIAHANYSLLIQRTDIL